MHAVESVEPTYMYTITSDSSGVYRNNSTSTELHVPFDIYLRHKYGEERFDGFFY